MNAVRAPSSSRPPSGARWPRSWPSSSSPRRRTSSSRTLWPRPPTGQVTKGTLPAAQVHRSKKQPRARDLVPREQRLEEQHRGGGGGRMKASGQLHLQRGRRCDMLNDLGEHFLTRFCCLIVNATVMFSAPNPQSKGPAQSIIIDGDKFTSGWRAGLHVQAANPRNTTPHPRRAVAQRARKWRAESLE